MFGSSSIPAPSPYPSPFPFGGSSTATATAASLFSSTPSPSGSRFPAFSAAAATGSSFSFVQSTPTPTPNPNPNPNPNPLLSSSPSPFPQTAMGSGHLTTQMAPVAPSATVSVPDRDIQTIVDAYRDDLNNPNYRFKHFLFSVTDPSMRIKPVGVSEIMWAEAMNKLEGMDSADREKLWPELVQGFKDISRRLKLQDEAIAADLQRLHATQSNLKLLERHFQVDTLTTIQRLQQKEQELQRRLLRIMRIVEALEGKGFRVLTTKAEAQLGERLRSLVRQLKGPGAELPRRVNNLLSESSLRGQKGEMSVLAAVANTAKVDEQSLDQMQEVLRQQTDAVSRLVGLLKRDMRDVEIIMCENMEQNEPDDFTRPARGNGIHSTFTAKFF